MTIYRISFCALFLLCAVSVFAQPRGSADTVTVDSMLSVERVVAGEEFKLALILDIKDKWHINAHKPAQEYLIGTEFKPSFQDHFILADIEYPDPVEYEFSFAGGELLLVYEDTRYIFMNIKTAPALSPGGYDLQGSLTVQGCDDSTCLAPSSIDVRMPLQVIPAGSETEAINSHIFADYDPGARPHAGVSVKGESARDIAALLDNRGLWALAAVFFMGLALNLTPCVYPMLSVTVSVFGSQSSSRTGTVFIKALFYVLGIATMYSLLGVIAAFSGRLFGFWLQSPLVLGLIGVMMLVLSLGMFGFYNMQVPYWITRRLGTGSFSGFAGTYISGMAVGIFAAPCIGPPIIALISFVGTRGDPVLGFQLFFILSLGLGFPYLILGAFTGLIQKLPRSGSWMEWVKKVFGVMLLGLGLFYIGLAFFPGLVVYAVAFTLLAGGVYLGFVEKTGQSNNVFRFIKTAFGTAVVIAGLMVLFNLQKEGIEWEDYSPEKIEYARDRGIPVIIDFYADWCVSCIELERQTFTHPGVIEASRDMIRLKVDMTSYDSSESASLRAQYEIAGVPTVIFLDMHGLEVPGTRVTGYVNPDRFMDKLRLVSPRNF